jgi:hypothetical protein
MIDNAQSPSVSAPELPPIPPNAVRVTSADYNGVTWDALPFSELPDWLLAAIDDGRIRALAADRDYALWRVGVKIAEPGDVIVRDEVGEVSVRKLIKRNGEYEYAP